MGIHMSDEKEPELTLELGEQIIRVSDKYRGTLKESTFNVRTVKVYLTNKRIAFLPSKWSAILNPLSILKEQETLILPLTSIKEAKKPMLGSGLNIVADKTCNIDFKALTGSWEADIKKAVTAAK